MDCGRAGWTADPHLSSLASQRKKTWRIRGYLDGTPRVLEWEAQTTRDLGRRLQCEPVWYDRLSPCGRVDPDSDWFKTDHRSQSGACSSVVETENEVHGEESCKLAWLGARRLLARCGYRNADGLEELEQDGTFACGNCEDSQEGGIQGDVRDRNGAQNTSDEKEENRTALRANSVELALQEKSIEKGETSGQDQGECRDGESPPRKREASISTGNHLQKTKIPNLFSQSTSETSTRFWKTRRRQPNPRDATG